MFPFIRSKIISLALAASVGLLGACASTPPQKPEPKLAFAGKEKIAVPAARIEFLDSYKPPLVAPNIEHEHAFRPSHLVRMWMNARLQPQSSAPGKIIVEITDASIIEAALETQGGLKGALRQEPERRLTGSLKWTMRYEGPDVYWKGDSSAQSSREIPEQATLNQVDKAYNEIIEALADHLDQQVEKQVELLTEARAQAAAGALQAK